MNSINKIILVSTLTAVTNIFSQSTGFDISEFLFFPVYFSKEKLQEDYIQMRHVLEENHPALYDYTDKRTLDSLFGAGYTSISGRMSYGEFYCLASSVLVRIGCGHTKFWIPDVYRNITPDGYFPFKLLITEGKVIVKGYLSKNNVIPAGSEIISVNGEQVKNIIDSLAGISSSDGFIGSFQIKSTEKYFPEKYGLSYGYPDKFRIEYIPCGQKEVFQASVDPVSREIIRNTPQRGEELSLKFVGNDTALLTINSFIYYDKVEMFRAFIDSSFAQISATGSKNLILDLRGNDGGDPFCSSYLLSYIEKKPVPYFAEDYGKYSELAKPVPLALNHFKGEIYTLIDGSIFSTTGHFCALLKYHKIGKFIGTETGATYTCTGNVKYIDLKNTKLILGTARERRYTAAVKKMDPMKGIEPDHLVEQTQADILEGIDTVMEYVKELIRKGTK